MYNFEVDQTEAAWVAGLLEGEGCFLMRSRGSRIKIECQMTDEDVVRKLQRLVQGGTIHHLKSKSYEGKKPVFRWALSRRVDVVLLLREILPHMGERRTQKISEMLAWHEENPSRYPSKWI